MSSIAEKGNPIKEFVLPAGILTLICTIAAAALVCTYQVTNPIIEENTRKATDAARAEVYTGVSGFEELSADGLENVTEVYKTSGGEGYVFTTTSKGFGGTIKVMTAISQEGKIVGVKVLENSETPGLGSRTALPAHLDQYTGKDSGLSGVEYITGATISSRSVNTAIESAFEAFGAVKGQ